MPAWAENLKCSVDAVTKGQMSLSSSLSAMSAKLATNAASSFQWKKEGLKRQYDVAAMVSQRIEAGEEAFQAGQHAAGLKFVSEGKDILIQHMHCLKIADASPGGWDTVNEYLASPLAMDDEDDKRIKRAEKAALDKIKERTESRKSHNSRASLYSPYPRNARNPRESREADYDTYTDRDRLADQKEYRSLSSQKSLSNTQQPTFIPHNQRQRNSGPRDVCYFCGAKGHWADTCPEKRSQQNRVSKIHIYSRQFAKTATRFFCIHHSLIFAHMNSHIGVHCCSC